MADSESLVSADVSAQATGTDGLQLRYYHNPFDISIRGTFTATVTLQRKRPTETWAADARDIKTYTAPAEEIGEVRGRWDVRLYVKTGDYTSGTATLELGTGG